MQVQSNGWIYFSDLLCCLWERYFDRENVLHKTPFDGTNPNVDGHEESVTLWGFALQARVDEKPMVVD